MYSNILKKGEESICPTSEVDLTDPFSLISPEEGVQYVTKTFVTGYKKGKEEFSCPILNSGENVYNRLGKHKKSPIKYYSNRIQNEPPPLHAVQGSQAYSYEQVNPNINPNQQLYKVQPNTVYYSSGLGNSGSSTEYNPTSNESLPEYSYATENQYATPIRNLYATLPVRGGKKRKRKTIKRKRKTIKKKKINIKKTRKTKKRQ